MTTRAELARKLGVARTVLADLERDGVVNVERDDRGVPRYSESEVIRVGELIRTGQLAVPPPSRAPKSVSTPRRRPPTAAVTEPSPILSDDAMPEIAVTVAPVLEAVDVSTTDTATPPPEDADDAVKRIRLAAVIARADLERIQAEALRDEAVRLLTEAARGRRLEYLVGATLETVLPWEREFVEPRLRQLLTGSDLEDSYQLRALVAGAINDARVQLTQQRAEADRIAAERREVAAAQQRATVEAQQRAAMEAQQRAAAARAADARVGAEQQAHAQAVARAQMIASTVAAEAAWQSVPPWVVEAVHHAAWNVVLQMDARTFYDDSAAMFVARSAGHQAAAVMWSMTADFEQVPPPFDERGPRRHRRRRR
ncbi:MAG: hypothetical protein NT062_06920 [Proteobacteria bacterium]|nr:hypothetical protein [Pseudomonadota bacterium]